MDKKVLFVDDSASMRQVVGLAIERAGYNVTTAVDGQDGVSKLGSARFDLIISDVNMPNMNGIEFIKQVKADVNNKFAPVIMLTTESADDMKQKGKEAGVKVWMVKPFKPNELLSVMTKLVG